MKTKMELFSLHLPRKLTRKEIESKLSLILKKGIEATYYAQTDDKMIAYTEFNVLTFINYSRDNIITIMKLLNLEEAEYFDTCNLSQDYLICVDRALDTGFSLTGGIITLKDDSYVNLIIIAHVISQSVALEFYELKLTDYYEKSRKLIDTADTFSIFKRTNLARFAKQLVLIRHDMLIELYLLDKPNILWDNENAEALYNRLAYELEVKDRFEVVEYKLNNIKDDIIMVMDLTNHNHSSFLEWIIIVLIGVEIIMGLYEWYGLGLSH